MTTNELREKIARIDIDINTQLERKDEDAALILMEARDVAQSQLDSATGAMRQRMKLIVSAPAQSITAPRNEFRDWMRNPENRIMTIGAGGTTTLPDNVATATESVLIKARDQVSVARTLASVVNYATTTNVLSLTARNTATWTAENAAFATSDLDAAKITFSAYKSTVITSVSVELLQDSTVAIENELAAEHGRAHGLLQEAAFMDGDGSSKPSGIFQATWTGAGNGTNTLAHMADLYYGDLAPAYQSTAAFVMHATVFSTLAQGVDTTGQFLLSGANGNMAVDGARAQLFGRPVYISAYAPTDKVFCGDLAVGFRIADRAGFMFQADPYTSAGSGLVRFLSYARTDSHQIDADAGAIWTIA